MMNLVVRAASMLVALFGPTGCDAGQVNADCVLATSDHVQDLACRRAHECRASFPITGQEFGARYGADPEACFTGPTLPVVTAIMTHAPSPEPNHETADAYFWRLLTNCVTAMARASCGDIASDALLQPGGYCGDDVMQGVVPPPRDLALSGCDDTLDEGCRAGRTSTGLTSLLVMLALLGSPRIRG
jgi:hypothetical protein